MQVGQKERILIVGVGRNVEHTAEYIKPTNALLDIAGGRRSGFAKGNLRGGSERGPTEKYGQHE